MTTEDALSLFPNDPESTAEAAPKRRRGRPRRTQAPQSVAVDVPSPAAMDAAPPLPVADAVPPPPVADAVPPPPAADVVPPPPVADAVPPPPAADVVPPPPVADAVPSPPVADAVPPPPAADAAPSSPVDVTDGGMAGADMRLRREAAMRMKRGIDDMSDSIAAMQAFFAKKATTQTAMAQQAKNIATKAAKRAAREQAARASAAKAAAARLSDAVPQKPSLPQIPGKVRLDRWGRPMQPQPESAAAAAAATATAGDGVPALPIQPVQKRELPLLGSVELLRCGASDLAALAEEARIGENGGVAFASRHDLILALMAEHARRGGAVEAEGYYIPTKEQAGVVVSAQNGLRRTPADVRVSAQFVMATGLRPGDYVVCRATPNPAGAKAPLSFEASDLVSVNGIAPKKACRRLPFDAFQPCAPCHRVFLSPPGGARGSWEEAADGAFPLAEGARAVLALPFSPLFRPSRLLAGLADSIAAANPALEVVLALFDPDTGTMASINAKNAEDRETGRKAALEAIFQDPADHADRAVSFSMALCEILRRRAANGRRVLLVTDAPGPFSHGFSRSFAGECAMQPDSASERESAEFRRLWNSARALEGAGSITVMASLGIESKAGALLFEKMRAEADWALSLAVENGEPVLPAKPGAGAAFSRFKAEALKPLEIPAPPVKTIMAQDAPQFEEPTVSFAEP